VDAFVFSLKQIIMREFSPCFEIRTAREHELLTKLNVISDFSLGRISRAEMGHDFFFFLLLPPSLSAIIAKTIGIKKIKEYS